MSRRKMFLTLCACVLVISLISATTLLGEEKTIKGTVEKTDAGFIIATEQGDYTAEGPDMAQWVGKKVEVTGEVEDMKITVKEIEETE